MNEFSQVEFTQHLCFITIFEFCEVKSFIFIFIFFLDNMHVILKKMDSLI